MDSPQSSEYFEYRPTGTTKKTQEAKTKFLVPLAQDFSHRSQTGERRVRKRWGARHHPRPVRGGGGGRGIYIPMDGPVTNPGAVLHYDSPALASRPGRKALGPPTPRPCRGPVGGGRDRRGVPCAAGVGHGPPKVPGTCTSAGTAPCAAARRSSGPQCGPSPRTRRP